MKLTSPSRIHMGLIDLNGNLGRVDGGLGVAIDYPNFKIEGLESDEIEIDFKVKIEEKDKIDIERRILDSARKVLSKIGENGIKLTVNGVIPAHSGLGSGTQISLSTGKITSLVYGHEINAENLAKITGRGGTSGIGVASFEKGGYIIDSGHSFGIGKDKFDFQPSSVSENVRPAPVIFRHDFNWDIVLTMPKGEQIYGEREVDMFKKYCPILESETEKICRIILMKMIPSVIENDLDSFGFCINELQKLGFKKAEVKLQSPAIKNMLEKLQKISYSGISSFGPTIYSLGDKKTIIEASNEYFDIHGIDGEIISTRANNTGFELTR
ncbi:beta-ribofuranosylaminobenzene 5'-phosphate synthase family [Methanococcus vannielii SB]|jgi:beta-ribofuranosylaminobenzene 5'-phosphate synthase|uniref:Beta-ribofuranosylaminobenzene 5'-phosphate synthase n=1 Tax=Methanococcus vannielii (strain ATCC 35089 / DSM 1224 / JCM 13029 / OCM 148 / SB) TaxID=406327 RepID=A6URR5_METVS|nr:beta-ribofuranosylaminobenzene 5'-phosphate synthase [Methanococcus vannielii]ABR55187.1 beta-ribofuranosylaminobenzene 5'-phosphate synthase family [Methanococcus vannielii SB]